MPASRVPARSAAYHRAEDGDGSSSRRRLSSWSQRRRSLLEITAADRARLARLAWHIGNRHLPAQIAGDRILIREDMSSIRCSTGLGAASSTSRRRSRPNPGLRRTLARTRRVPHGHHEALKPRFYRLLAWCRRLPAGAFSYSHGLEWAVETGMVATRDAWRLGGDGNAAGAAEVTRCCSPPPGAPPAPTIMRRSMRSRALAAAWRGTAETALESRAQGAAFLATTLKAWPHLLLDALALRHRGEGALPVAVAVACGGPRHPAGGGADCLSPVFAANLVSAGVRLIPLGQTDGQRVMAALAGVIAAAAADTSQTPLGEIGTAAPLSTGARCGTKRNTQGCFAHDPVIAWAPAGRHRRSRRLGQDRTGRTPLQAFARDASTSPSSPTISIPRRTRSS